jgi:hypothetical protein
VRKVPGVGVERSVMLKFSSKEKISESAAKAGCIM